MSPSSFESQLLEVNNEIRHASGVCFDPENVRLEGTYSDQLSAYRARRSWIEALERCFLLDLGHDFEVHVISNLRDSKYALRADFLTACARYAFWRLTNQQAPEAQYMIETGHIPSGNSHYEDMVAAPDLRCQNEPKQQPLVEPFEAPEGNIRSTVLKVLDRIIQRFR